jgi:cobyric acid synthase
MKMAIFELPYRGQRDEFLPLRGDPAMQVAWVRPPSFFEVFPSGVDVIALPGSGRTVSDLEYLRQSGGEQILRSHLSRGGRVIGICGGYQMLGEMLFDPLRKQGAYVATEGLSLLPTSTLFGPTLMSTDTVGLCALASSKPVVVQGEEHRSGIPIASKTSVSGFQPLNLVVRRTAHKLATESDDHTIEEQSEPFTPEEQWLMGVRWAPGTENLDGFVSDDRRLWATYIHRIFDSQGFRRLFFADLP